MNKIITQSKISTLFIFVLLLSFSCTNKENDHLITISTPHGNIQLVLFDQTPLHKKNFLKLVDEKFYDDMAIHTLFRQYLLGTGNPKTKSKGVAKSEWGLGGADYTIPAEINANFKFVRGTIAAVREDDAKNPTKASNGSAFAIILSRKSVTTFEGRYTAFGHVISGYDVLERLELQAVDKDYRPITDIRIKITATPMTKSQIFQTFGYRFPQ